MSLRCFTACRQLVVFFLWSKLDKIIKNSESLNTFKAKIRKLDLVGLLEDNC